MEDEVINNRTITKWDKYILCT